MGAVEPVRRGEVHSFSRPALDALIDNEIQAVRLPGFADQAEVSTLAALLLRDSIRTHSVPTVTRLGISQYEQGVRGSKQHYFAAARALEHEMAAVFGCSFSPVARLLDRLRSLGFDADVMAEPGWGRYWAGTGKLRDGATPIHVDYSPQDSDGWAVGEVTAQLAWNVYLSCEPADELVVWDRQWVPQHDVHQVPGEYYYDEAVVAGAGELRIPPLVGDVVIINARNYHTVVPCRERLAFGSFIGVTTPGTLRLWS
ncbi:MAG: hypothetical protein OES57_02665 [Acidimicrobiia bacterium]|nr:hypothetical protein [Acidimicrobiia bacterium]